MSTELQTYQQPQAALIDYQTRAVQRLADWVASADAAYQVAQRLVQSSFVPQQFRDKPIEATAAILAGSEVGLSPMASLRAFDVIQGTAAPKAITLRAIVLSFGHEIELVESTATRCVMRGRRRGSVNWQKVTWTIDRAKDLGLTSKDQYKKQPGTMLVARCTSELCRLIAADAILGIGYTSEELVDGADPSQPVETIAEPSPEPGADQPATRRMSRLKPAPEPVVAVEADDPVLDKKGLAHLHAALGELGVGKGLSAELARTSKLEYCSDALGRELESSSEITESEAVTIHAQIKKDLADLALSDDEREGQGELA